MKKITQNLIQLKEGVILPAPHGSMIWEGKQDLIIKSKFHRNQINRLLYLLDNDNCYGVIKLTCPEKITVKQFEELSDQHKFSEEERGKWWGSKEVLFSYKFSKIAMFEKPKPIKILSKISHTFAKDFEFTNLEETFIDIQSYNPSQSDNNKLSNDLKIVLAWYSTKKTGGTVKYSLEQITQLSSKIYDEMKIRIDSGKINNNDVKSLLGELNNIVSKVALNSTSQITLFDPMHPIKKFSELDDAVKYMFQKGNKFGIEKKIKGERAILIKDGNNIRLFSDNKDITNDFKSIALEAIHLSPKDMILDGQLSNNKLYVFDAIQYGSDISGLPWHERKQIVNSLNFTNNIKEVNSIIVDNQKDAYNGLKLLRHLNESEGAIIKVYNGDYTKGLEGESWISVVNTDATTTDDSNEVSGEQEGKEVSSQEEQGPEDLESKDWDEKKTTKKMASVTLGGIKYTSTPIVNIDGENLYIEGHRHQWSENRSLTSIDDRHKHKLDFDKMVTEKHFGTDSEFSNSKKYDGHYHKLLDNKGGNTND